MALIASYAAVVGVGTAVNVCPFLAPAILPAIGFSTVGPVAGTIAAGAQIASYAVVVGVGAVLSFCSFCPSLAPAILPAIGFSTAGPVAGTIAAGAQSYMGVVAAGSYFSMLQSIAMSPAIL